MLAFFFLLDTQRCAGARLRSDELSHLLLPQAFLVLLDTKTSGAAASPSASRFQSFMNHPAGAPPPPRARDCLFLKWCLVAVGLKDLN
ncbi:hypothetical protein BC827DRAFT_1135062 [Russula dissimulans]|nr:hypothetical protein BC827DRAFT_1135062 [Russula dissimulans]